MKLNLSLSFLVILMGCQARLEPSVKPMPSILSPTSRPSILPSIAASSSTLPSITPKPTASPFPAELLGKSHYTPRFPCKEIQTNDISNPVLTAPRDIAVTQDGKEIYITLNTPFVKGFRNGGIFHTESKTKVLPLERTHLYRMKFYKPDDSTTSVVNIDQDYRFSCGFNGEIEMTPDNQLLLSYPEIDDRSDLKTIEPPAKSHHFYYLNLQSNQTQSILKYDFTFSISNDWGLTNATDPRRLTNMHLDSDGSIYFYLNGPGDALDNQILRWNAKMKLFESLIAIPKQGQSVSTGAISAKGTEKVILNIKEFEAPFPKNALNVNTRLEVTGVTCPKLSSSLSGFIPVSGNLKSDGKGNFYFTGQVFSFGTTPNSLASFIWKQTPDNQITCIAGNGKNGYLDGKGLEASFNQPSELDIDAAGNIYVADTGNNAIRKITPDGDVTTLYRAPDMAK